MGDTIGVGRLAARRHWFNETVKWVVALGGAAVIGAITLIFAYLLWVVGPTFLPGDIDAGSTFAVTEREPLLVDVSENGEVLLRISADGVVEFFNADSGQVVAAFSLGMELKSVSRIYPTVDHYAIIDVSQGLRILRTQYVVEFVDGVRKLTPRIDFPFGTTPAPLGQSRVMDLRLTDERLTVAMGSGQRVVLRQYRGVEEGLPLRRPQEVAFEASIVPDKLFVGPRHEWLYAIDGGGTLEMYDISPLNDITRLMRGNLALEGAEITAVGSILGRYSLVTGDSNGVVSQWSVSKNEQGFRLDRLRTIKLDTEISHFVMEPRRKGFAGIHEDGQITLMYPTSGREIATLATTLQAGQPMAISPRSNRLIAATHPGELAMFELENKHPEISFSTLWGEVWYEGYSEPIFSWQSSSADNDFEPKFSLTPLAFGTLKAAFYALLFAVPIAIMGAIYTAYFMAPAMRNWVKPGIEIMAALPTVILGFIGGLWLAPIIESNLSSVLTMFVLLPVGLFGFALLWSQFPEKLTRSLGGWYGLIAVPIVVLVTWSAFSFGPVFEDAFFGGDSRAWFREVLGLNYDQRNALVVGIIMGLAVIPVIFSIAEDAIYGVPDHLTNGSLALGATPWQTLVRVVLLTASPGIFSAVMIGMGRAVGETMIVLMATGNTPLMDFNIFEGMRTFAANIAVELPEAEVDSSHYRILFLTALVLFILTFVFNTAAEVVRARLRDRYGSL